jgi:hypothetical protein
MHDHHGRLGLEKVEMVNWARAIPCLLSLVLVAAACSDVNDVNPDPPAPSQRPSARAPGHGVPAPPAIDLKCSSGSTGLVPGGTELHGVATEFFGWRPELWQEGDLRSFPTITLEGRRYYKSKSEIYVFENASAKTRITLLSPPNARLYYTDWANWATLGRSDEPGQSREIAAHSSTVVNVPRCGEDSWGAPGMLLLEGPGCITFRVTGQKPDWEVTRTVPFYTERC